MIMEFENILTHPKPLKIAAVLFVASGLLYISVWLDGKSAFFYLVLGMLNLGLGLWFFILSRRCGKEDRSAT